MFVLQVHQYMRALSPSAVPLVGSPGDRNRIRRLLRQLPPHDNDSRYCHVTLSQEQKQEFASFCARRKHEALGRGVVQPLLPVDPPNDVVCQQVLTSFCSVITQLVTHLQ